FRNYTVADSMALKMRNLNKVEKATGANTNEVKQKKKITAKQVVVGAIILVVLFAVSGA
ncbi:MAG: hypothetical protein RLZZ161_1464, partial [Bacteroidota bacterium]